ncbi:MAG TPA: ATP-binding protein [Opitutaceae bacterium]|jgi:signal transduction histidine kinase|nr:ATP-binding protein [Opitutaceae bacterium]
MTQSQPLHYGLLEHARTHAVFLRIGVLGVLLVFSVIACLSLAMLITSNVLRQHEKVEIEATMLARQYRKSVNDMQNTLLRIAPASAKATSLLIHQHRQELNEWLAMRLAVVESDEERQVLARLGGEMRAYFEMLDQLALSTDGFRIPIADGTVTKCDDGADRLENIADDFAAIHDRKLQGLFQASLGSIFWMRNLVFVCLALLVAAIGGVVVLMYHDVVRPLREQLVDSKSLFVKREKLAALGTLAAGVAHEIRNPLTAIKARLHTLSSTLSTSSGREDVQAITMEVGRLERIVRDVLGYAHPAKPTLYEVELSTWLREFAAVVEPGINTHNIQLLVDIAAPVRVFIDTNQLRQIMLNLVCNAQEALAGRAGRIVLSLRRERARLLGKLAPVAVLAVTDDGPGVPPEIQLRLFDPFFTTKAAGTGLGLSIVSRLVENQGGQITFQSSPDAGTRFSVYLPVSEAAPP